MANYIQSLKFFGFSEKNPIVSIIIVNFNGGDLLIRLVEQILNIADAPVELVIVDNRSTDKSIEKLIDVLDRNSIISENVVSVRIARLRRNFGPNIGYNIGVFLSRAPYIMIINNDILFGEYFSIRMLLQAFKRLERFGIGAVTVKALKMHNPRLIDTAGTLADKLLYTTEYGSGDKEDKPEYNRPYIVSSVPLVFSLMPRKLYLKAGMLDPYYFAGYEDLDLSLRIQLLGYRLLYLPWFKILHFRGGTSGRNEFKPLITYLFARGYFFNVFSFLNLYSALLAVIIRFILIVIQSLVERNPLRLYLGFFKPFALVMRSRYFGIKRRIVARLKEKGGKLWLSQGLVLKALLKS